MTNILVKLKSEIDNLDTYESEEVKNIINRHSIPYTKNSNGIFINMKNFDKDVIKDLKLFIEFSKKSRKILENKSKEIDNEKKNINSLIRNNKLPFNVKVKDIDDLDEEKEYKKEYYKILKSSYKTSVIKEKDKQSQNQNHNIQSGRKMNKKMKFSGLKEKILKSLKEKKKKRIQSIDLIISSLIQLNNEENIRKKTKKRRRRKKSKKNIIKNKDIIDNDMDDDILINDNLDDIDENQNEDEEDLDEDNDVEDDEDDDDDDEDDNDDEDNDEDNDDEDNDDENDDENDD